MRDRRVAMLREWDEVTISGYCLSEGRFFYHLRGTIGTIDGDSLKLWPLPEPIGDGKLWFDRRFVRLVKFHKYPLDT